MYSSVAPDLGQLRVQWPAVVALISHSTDRRPLEAARVLRRDRPGEEPGVGPCPYVLLRSVTGLDVGDDTWALPSPWGSQ